MSVSNHDLAAVVQMSESDILEQIAIAYAGSTAGPSNTLSIKSMDLVRDIQMAARPAGGLADNRPGQVGKSVAIDLSAAGDKIVKWAWPKIHALVCDAYAKKDDLGKIAGKDWVSYVVAAIASAVGLSSGLALLVIGWAVKQGLDVLCAVPDAQPTA